MNIMQKKICLFTLLFIASTFFAADASGQFIYKTTIVKKQTRKADFKSGTDKHKKGKQVVNRPFIYMYI